MQARLSRLDLRSINHPTVIGSDDNLIEGLGFNIIRYLLGDLVGYFSRRLFAWQLHPRWIRHDISVRNFEMKFRHFHPPQGEIAMRSVCSAGGTIMINEPYLDRSRDPRRVEETRQIAPRKYAWTFSQQSPAQ